eukprot:1637628-Pyramimonas_sp.AAC.2
MLGVPEHHCRRLVPTRRRWPSIPLALVIFWPLDTQVAQLLLDAPESQITFPRSEATRSGVLANA